MRLDYKVDLSHAYASNQMKEINQTARRNVGGFDRDYKLSQRERRWPSDDSRMSKGERLQAVGARGVGPLAVPRRRTSREEIYEPSA